MSVVDSLKAEFQTYSSVVLQNTQSSVPVISKEGLKEVVKNVVNEEDHRCNVVIFGLLEEEGEELNDRVEELFTTTEHKPRLEACRIRKNNNTQTSRPVKISVSSSAIADQLLANARKSRLKVERFKTVLVSPDCSLE